MSANGGSRSERPAMHWARRLGEQRHTRDECAVRTAKAEAENATRTTAVSLQRWPAIVACIRGMADGYNGGARRVVLTVLEQPGQPAVTVTAEGTGTPYLTAILDDTVICSHGSDSRGLPHAGEVRLRPDRDDDATAAYVLQNWMQHL